MKYMILSYASQQDYDGMAGRAGDQPAWTSEEVAAMGVFMEGFNAELAQSGRTRGDSRVGRAGPYQKAWR